MRVLVPLFVSLFPAAAAAQSCNAISGTVVQGGIAAAISLGSSLQTGTLFRADPIVTMDGCKIFVEMMGPEDLQFPRPEEIKAAACSGEGFAAFVAAGGEVEVTHLMHVTRRPTIVTISSCDEAP
jgi:hypothetical protein